MYIPEPNAAPPSPECAFVLRNLSKFAPDPWYAVKDPDFSAR